MFAPTWRAHTHPVLCSARRRVSCQWWKQRLHCQLLSQSRSRSLESCSASLAGFRSQQLEIPGQYSGDREPQPELHTKLQYFAGEVQLLQRNSGTQRRLLAMGDDGLSYPFLVQYMVPHLTRTDERSSQMVRPSCPAPAAVPQLSCLICQLTPVSWHILSPLSGLALLGLASNLLTAPLFHTRARLLHSVCY